MSRKNLKLDIEDITCPITKAIFTEPMIICEDGHNVDKSRLLQLKENKQCPCCEEEGRKRNPPPFIKKSYFKYLLKRRDRIIR